MTGVYIGLALAAAIAIWWLQSEGKKARAQATRAQDEVEDLRRDQTEAARIDRAVDAVRHDGTRRVRGSEPDTRGYRD